MKKYQLITVLGADNEKKIFVSYCLAFAHRFGK